MSGDVANQQACPTRQPPPYFAEVQQRARARWNQLEADPGLAGPWRQLFRQVQSPRHVLSELLQNADDVGATDASARIEGDTFIFEHDGRDFTAEEFESLCQFGFSNKRKLHTIGFRGIGFKSTFSLGEVVDVLTPTLAAQFHEARFTEPLWLADAPASRMTAVGVGIADSNRKAELAKNLEEWTGSGASLLFFGSIHSLDVQGTVVQWHDAGPGPAPGIERLRQSGGQECAVTLIRSGRDAFPTEAEQEVRKERGEDINLPPCTVAIAMGLPAPQRLFVVLPTGVELDLPFSCNAPFVQDPARQSIKAPSLSPTNRWLLHRLGRLAGEAMLAWLGNADLPNAERVRAYDLIPSEPKAADSVEADCRKLICDGFREVVEGKAVLLTAEGALAGPKSCLPPPRALYAVWPPRDLQQVFGGEGRPVLAEEVPSAARKSLASWGWLEALSADRAIEVLSSQQRPPKPDSWAALLHLWAFVQGAIGYDYEGRRRRKVNVVPVDGESALFAAEETVRASTKRDGLAADDWDFLRNLVHVLDREWPEWLSARANEKGEVGPEKAIQAAMAMLRDCGLDSASPASTLVARASARLFSPEDVSLGDCVRLAQIAAALGAQVPDGFKYATRDGKLHYTSTSSQDVVEDSAGQVEALVPSDWADGPAAVGEALVADDTTGEADQDLPAGRQVGAKVVTHSRYVIFQMAEVAVPRWLFRVILERIQRLRPREPVPG